MDINTLRQRLQANGLVGAGGAGFPSWAKLDERCQVVILNCAESEPLLTLHQQLLAMRTREILLGLSALAEALDAKAVVALGEAHTSAIQAVESALSSFPNISMQLLPDVYPSGDEVQVCYACTGKLPPAGKLPIEVGVIVYNVETVYNAYRALQYGAPVTDKFVTVAGVVRRPGTFLAPLGTPFSALIQAAGGFVGEDLALIHGGPMTGRLAQLTDPVVKTSNGVLVLPKHHPAVAMRLARTQTKLLRARAACCQCQMCTDLCPRYLLGYPVEPHRFMRGASSLLAKDVDAYVNTLLCCQCGLCELFACGQGLAPRALMGECRDRLRKEGVKAPETALPELRQERAWRGISTRRLVQRLGLAPYEDPATFREENLGLARLWLPLKMHVGVAGMPCVEVGQAVEQGQVLADGEGLCVPLHAPRAGKITAVLPDGIELEVAERG